MNLVERPNGVETSFIYDDGRCTGTLNEEKSSSCRTQVGLGGPW